VVKRAKKNYKIFLKNIKKGIKICRILGWSGEKVEKNVRPIKVL
jgi:hypothetical protein